MRVVATIFTGSDRVTRVANIFTKQATELSLAKCNLMEQGASSVRKRFPALYRVRSNCQNQLPEDLQLVSAAQVRSDWRVSDAVLYRLEKTGKLVPLRFGRRRYYSVGALRKFLDAAQSAGLIAVPWKNPSDTSDRANQREEVER